MALLRRPMTIVGALCGVMLVGSCLAVLATRARAFSIPAISCDQIINAVASPRLDGYRPVLGLVSVPPAYMAQRAVPVTGSGRWTYWHKAGVAVHSGSFTVTVAVPRPWRSRVAITWGNQLGEVLRFSGCAGGAFTHQHAWNGYAGGFYLRRPAACVPLMFSDGRRSATLRFGIGERCP
jgi:hypothetical protein